MENLQKLDVEWDIDAMEQLTVILKNTVSGEEILKSTDSWIRYWQLKRFTPQKINIVTHIDILQHKYECAILDYWVSLNAESPAGSTCTGHLKLFNNLKVPLNLSPALPPYVCASSIGLQGIQSDLLLLISFSHGDCVVNKATIEHRNFFSS